MEIDFANLQLQYQKYKDKIDVNLQKIIGHFPGIHESYTLAGDKYYGLDVTINN